jgi:hypothetical protein
MDHHLSPPHHPPHHQMSLPTFARSIPVEVATQPASTRTSFTRVDHTRPGTSAGDDGQRDEADPNDEAARASLRDEPEEQEAASIPQIPQTMLQFLLVSGRRRSMVFEPETTVGRVKELVWNTWPNGVSRSHSHSRSRPLFFCPGGLSIHLISYSWNCRCRVRFSPPSRFSLRPFSLLSWGKGRTLVNFTDVYPCLTLRQTGRTSAHRPPRTCASSI